jgi:hypothetical protein
MMGIVDVLLAATDPVSTLLLLGILAHVRWMREDLRKEIVENRERVERVEDVHIE